MFWKCIFLFAPCYINSPWLQYRSCIKMDKISWTCSMLFDDCFPRRVCSGRVRSSYMDPDPAQTEFIWVHGSRGIKWREFFFYFVIINYIFQEPKKVAYLRFRYRFDNIFFSTLSKDGLKSIWFRPHQILWIRIPIQSTRIHITGLIYTDIFASLTNVTVEIKN